MEELKKIKQAFIDMGKCYVNSYKKEGMAFWLTVVFIILFTFWLVGVVAFKTIKYFETPDNTPICSMKLSQGDVCQINGYKYVKDHKGYIRFKAEDLILNNTLKQCSTEK